MDTGVLTALLFKMLFMGILGFGMNKIGIMNDDFRRRLSAMMLKVVIPLNILAVGNTTYDAAMARNLLWAALIVLAFYLLSIMGLMPIRRLLRLSAANRNLFVNLALLSNVGYIGFPIIEQLYGAEGTLYAIVLNLGFQLLSFTFSIRMMGGELSLRGFFTNPMTVCPLLAIVIFMSPFRLPAPVVGAFSEVGSLSAAFSMFIIGSSMAHIRFSSLWTDLYAWLVLFLRQLAAPGLLALALWAAGFSGFLPATMVVLCGMPSATINVIFAEQYNADLPFATRSVVLGCLAMMLSLPLWALVNSWLFL